MQHSSNPKKALLGELESIVDILDDSQGKKANLQEAFNCNFLSDSLFSEDFEQALDRELDDTLLDIPLLNDVVQDESSPAPANTPLLDLERIFNDELFESDVAQHKSATQPKAMADEEPSANKERSSLELPLFSRIENSDEEQSEMFPILEQATPLANEVPEANINSTNDHNKRHNDCPSNHHTDIHLLIQELVDEFIPTLETQLRNQLTELAPEVIQELAKKHLES